MQKENNDQLRPSMGHPNADEEIRVLSEREAERHAAFAAGVDVHAKELQELVGRQGQEFVQKLATMTESMLRDFDAILTIDDVEKGRKTPLTVIITLYMYVLRSFLLLHVM